METDHNLEMGAGPAGDGPPLLRVCALGPVEMEVEGVPVPISRPVQRALMAALAAAKGAYVDLIGAAPNGQAGDASRRAVATNVWRLRDTLGPARDVLLASGRPARYALDRTQTVFSTVEFDELCRAGRARLHAGEPEAAVRALSEGLALWRGTPFAELGDLPAVRAERAYLDELRVGASEDLATALLEVGRPLDAVPVLEGLLRALPLHEQASTLLIRALLTAGRHDEAVRAFDEVRGRLADVGLEPGLALQGAASALASGADPRPATLGATRQAVRAATRQTAPGAVVQLPGPFVGRQVEVDRLVELVTAPRRTSCLALVLGGPGAGKTRVAAEVAARVAPGRPVHFLPISRDSRDPFGALVELARMLMADAPPAVQADPEIARLLDPSDPTVQPSEVAATDTQVAFLDRLLDLIREACADGALLVIDDAHASSTAMLALLRRLASGEVPRPVTVLAVVRTPVRDEGVLAAAQELAVGVVHLAGLDRGDIREVAVAVLGTDVDGAALDWIDAQTAGNPLFLSVLLQDADVRRALAGGALPASREGLVPAVARFVAGFAGSERDVLRAAACLGPEPFDRALVLDVCTARGLEPAAVDAAIAQGIARSVLVVARDALDSFTFRHGLIRDALADEVGPVERPLWHRACAVAVERRAAHDPALVHAVAGHHARAWPHTTATEAATWLIASATAMTRLADHAAAAAQLETAAALLARDPSSPVPLAVQVQLDLARARIDSDDAERAFTAIRAAAHLARRVGWVDGVAMAAVRGADVVDPTAAWRDELEGLLIEAVRGADELDASLRGRALTALALLRPGLADRVTAEVVERFRSAGSALDLGSLLAELWMVTDAAEQLALADEVVALGAAAGSASLEASGLLRRWQSAVRTGQARLNEPLAERVARLVEEAADPVLDWRWLSWSATRAVATGQFERADDLLGRMLRLPMHLGRERLGPPASRVLSLTAGQRGILGFLRNDPSAITYAVRAASATWSIAGLDHRWLKGLRHPTTGENPQEVLDLQTSGLRSMVRRTAERVLAAAFLGDGAAPVGHRRGIEAAREVMLEHTGEHLAFEHVYYGTVDQHLGWIDLYAGEWDAAILRFEASLIQLDQVGSAPFIVRIRRNLVAALRGRGDARDLDRIEELEAAADTLAAQLGVLGGTYRPRLSPD